MKLNYNLAGFVKINKHLTAQEEAGRRGICGRHLEPLKRFCKDDEVLVCTSCEEEHRGHNIMPAEEAAQEYKDRISASLEALKKRREIIMATISATQAESEDLFKQMETERRKMAVKFGDLWPFLNDQGDRMVARMKETEEQMQREKDQHMDRLDQPVSSLEDLISEMEEKRELPARRLLQDVGSILKGSEQKVEIKNPGDFPLELKQKVSNFTDRRPCLERAVKKLKETVTSCY